jgi:hypothetical protein
MTTDMTTDPMYDTDLDAVDLLGSAAPVISPPPRLVRRLRYKDILVATLDVNGHYVVRIRGLEPFEGTSKSIEEGLEFLADIKRVLGVVAEANVADEDFVEAFPRAFRDTLGLPDPQDTPAMVVPQAQQQGGPTKAGAIIGSIIGLIGLLAVWLFILDACFKLLDAKARMALFSMLGVWIVVVVSSVISSFRRTDG